MRAGTIVVQRRDSGERKGEEDGFRRGNEGHIRRREIFCAINKSKRGGLL
jgi:hypothetical protein